MLTYDSLMEAFSEYHEQANDWEVVKTSKGYAIIIWDEDSKAGYDEFIPCASLEDLRDALLETYEGYLQLAMEEKLKFEYAAEIQAKLDAVAIKL